MKIRLELSEIDLKTLVSRYLNEKYGDDFNADQIVIEVKSKQNYKSEWESASFRAVYEVIK